jgi:hypothetical protein
MYNAALQRRPAPGNSGKAGEQPSLFREFGFELREPGEPWSPTRPPLVDLTPPSAGADPEGKQKVGDGSDSDSTHAMAVGWGERQGRSSHQADHHSLQDGSSSERGAEHPEGVTEGRGCDVGSETGLETDSDVAETPAGDDTWLLEIPTLDETLPEPSDQLQNNIPSEAVGQNAAVEMPKIEERSPQTSSSGKHDRGVDEVGCGAIAAAGLGSTEQAEHGATSQAASESAFPGTMPTISGSRRTNLPIPLSPLPRPTAHNPTPAPKRIGSGRLVPARLTWKPRDPFAAEGTTKTERFRWEVMLTSACITAVCGLACVWLLRTLLA